jgi:NAD(P)-dependent dehydrogenase (short-subunit alcohol dehydrogenase family)
MTLSIDLFEKRAVVTGVSSGIGAGIALALAQAGCDVAGCGLDTAGSPGALRFLDGAKGYGRRAFYQELDLADPQKARTFVDWSASHLGGLDIVVSNAGRNIFIGVENTSEADWNANLELNLAAHWRLAQAAKSHLEQASQPVIIIVGSNHAYRTLPNCFPYNVAKAGLTALVQSLALEWGPHIRTVGIAPGFIETAQSENWFNNFPDPQAKRAQVAAIHPVGRMGTPADMGALCAFLCSPLAGFISGTTLLMDGGRSAVMQDV